TPRKLFDDVAAPVDHRADSGRRRTKHWNPFLGGAEPRLGEVLRRPPAAEPGVVRRIKNERWAVVFVDDIAREDHLIAELEADLAELAAEVDRARSRNGREVDVAGRVPRQADGGKQR